VAYTYNPSYSGGRDQGDHSSKLALANISQDPMPKIPNAKRTFAVAQGIDPEFKKE
jgi:hypothetical protein